MRMDDTYKSSSSYNRVEVFRVPPIHWTGSSVSFNDVTILSWGLGTEDSIGTGARRFDPRLLSVEISYGRGKDDIKVGPKVSQVSLVC